ncbi:MAG: 2-amino-4-hydroxy-6-hydroxymethyldihydropteridine diphosphokinase [Acidobacteria bacterium]|nr:2-amino-4-hydroxy-6-hydroxymethyldihydropteridine diphosphokinase [Acidobacteriota bacterium]
MKNLERVGAANRRIFFGLGANLGDCETNLRDALERLNASGLRLVHWSSIYETEPVGYADQEWFLNQVVEVAITPAFIRQLPNNAGMIIEKALEKRFADGLPQLAAELLLTLLTIENAMGRRREFLNSPRCIDIDLLCVGDLVISSTLPPHRLSDETTHTIIVPHPRLHLRRFVLAPLCEIAPDLIHPVLQKSVAEILAALKDQALVRPLKEQQPLMNSHEHR